MFQGRVGKCSKPSVHSQTVLPKCPSKSVILRQSYQSQCFAKSVVPRVLHESFSVGCMRRVPYKSVAPRLSCQESLTKTVLPECDPNPLLECLAKPVSPEYHIRRVIPTMSYKVFSQVFLTRVVSKSVLKECHNKRAALRTYHESVSQQYPTKIVFTRVSYSIVLPRVSSKSKSVAPSLS